MYVVLRRPTGTGAFAEIARTAAVTYTDAPPSGTVEYVVRTAVSSFTSGDSPAATVTVTP